MNLGWTGVALLGVVMLTGYRNVIAAFRQDPDGGRVKLTYFVVAATYNFTEAGFRMMDPVWIFFLMAIAVVPKAPIREDTNIRAQVSSDQYCVDLPARTDIYEEVV